MAWTESLGRRGECFGASLAARAVAFSGRRVAGWLVAHGCPRAVASGVLWTAGIAILAVVICLAAAVALMLQLVSALSAKGDLVLPETEDEGTWRDGLEGFGLYKGFVRIDHLNRSERD